MGVGSDPRLWGWGLGQVVEERGAVKSISLGALGGARLWERWQGRRRTEHAGNQGKQTGRDSGIDRRETGRGEECTWSPKETPSDPRASQMAACPESTVLSLHPLWVTFLLLSRSREAQGSSRSPRPLLLPHFSCAQRTVLAQLQVVQVENAFYLPGACTVQVGWELRAPLLPHSPRLLS